MKRKILETILIELKLGFVMLKLLRIILISAVGSLIISLGAGSTLFLIMLFIGIPLDNFFDILIGLAICSFVYLLFKNIAE